MMITDMKLYKLFIFLLACITVISCERDDTPKASINIGPSTPDKFLQYPNVLPSLAAGTYTIVAATVNTAEADSFTLTITKTDGTQTTQSGSWVSSGGKDSTSVDNPRFNFTLETSGGISIALNSTVDNYLYLLDRADNILYENDNNGSANNALLNLPASRINNKQWTDAYYAAIDPNNERDTLAKWKTKNGFDAGYDVHVIFRDTIDLGYGRSMFMRRNLNGCLAFYVENFFVNVIEGLPYSTLNLDAAIANDHIHHFGVNAIEFSDLDGDCDGNDPMFNKFYTFDINTGQHFITQSRLSSIDLDGRGQKFMPLPCITCHGGTAKPLLADGSFASGAPPGAANPELRLGDTTAKLQPLVLDSYEYSNAWSFSLSEQDAKLQDINNAAFSTYTATRADGEWDADFMREVVDGWYSGNFTTTNKTNISKKNSASQDQYAADFLTNNNTTIFDKTFVPQGWKYDPADLTIPATRPATSEELFLKVIKPYCFSCHSKRGTTLGSNGSDSNNSGQSSDINFSNYEKFISFSDQIENYVYARGQMPMSRLAFDQFWASNAPEILASHITNFKYANTDGSIDQPGKPIAHAGLDRTVVSPVTISAEASVFATTYNWQITAQPVASVASIGNANTLRSSLTADTNGDYTLQLTVNNAADESSTDSVTITIDDTLSPTQTEITFNTHIIPLLQGGASLNCTLCHSASGLSGIPVYYDADSGGYTTYENIKQRINFSNVAYSRLLQKPTGNHHNGGTPITLPENYNMLVNWILEGAREN
jgi:mono/diheme cytochrome c family protein